MTPVSECTVVQEQAVEWMLRLREGDLSVEERAAFDRWHADPRCSEVFARLARAAGAFEVPRRLGVKFDDVLRTADTRGMSRRTAIKGTALGVLGVSVAAWVGVRGIPGQGSLRTSIGNRETIALPDSSQLVLNADTSLQVGMSGDERRLQLTHGRVLARVAPGSSRPFVIATRFGTIRALGTVFQVEVGSDAAEAAVIESKVQIRTLNGSVGVVEAGRRARFSADHIGPNVPLRQSETDWTRGVYAADDVPLEEVIENLRPYMHGAIRLDPAVAHLPISGVFLLDDPLRTLNALPQVVPVKIEHIPLWTTISPR